MKKKLLLAAFFCSAFALSSWAESLKLWYKQPAQIWVEALPLGNSTMGVMVYGGIGVGQLPLNVVTMWGGGCH